MNYRIAIPSKGRAYSLFQLTIKTLREAGFPKDIIDIFVVPDELEKYKLYSEADPHYDKIIPGVSGLSNQRELIKNFYAEDQNIFFVDDDINNFKILPNLKPLPQIIDEMFLITKAEGCHIFALYPVANLFFQKPRILKGKIIAVGAAYGFINNREQDTYEDEKEDVQRSCYWIEKDGAILRLEAVGIQTRYFKGTGGLQAVRTADSIKEASERVHQQYPLLLDSPVLKKAGKKGQYWDVKFTRAPKTIIPLSSQLQA